MARAVLCFALCSALGLAGPPESTYIVRSPNFTVHAPDRDVALDISSKAESLRTEFSARWFGKAFRRWYAPCPIHVKVNESSGSGETTYTFDRGEVSDWKMVVAGTRQALLDNVIPHEVTHAVMATFYRRPIPRWADEGFATRAESQAERAILYKKLLKILNENRAIAFGSLLAMVDYPDDKFPLYTQGFTLTTMLIEARDEWHFLNFLSDAISDGDWTSSVKEFYGFSSLDEMELAWKKRIKAGGF